MAVGLSVKAIEKRFSDQFYRYVELLVAFKPEVEVFQGGAKEELKQPC